MFWINVMFIVFVLYFFFLWIPVMLKEFEDD